VIAYGNDDDDDDDETMFNQGHPIAVLSRTLAKLELQKYINTYSIILIDIKLQLTYNMLI
jgi:hypothetical protein